jgi:hypothetical protein
LKKFEVYLMDYYLLVIKRCSTTAAIALMLSTMTLINPAIAAITKIASE